MADPLDLLMEWHAVNIERRAVPRSSSIGNCEYVEEGCAPEGQCYGSGQLFNGQKSCGPCRERLERFMLKKRLGAKLRSVEARMARFAIRAAEQKGQEVGR